MSTSAPSTSTARKRSSRACDGCKQCVVGEAPCPPTMESGRFSLTHRRRMKCEDILPSPTTGEPTCKLCREARQDCTFETPVRKRGPAPGFRRRGALGSRSPGNGSDTGEDEKPERRSIAPERSAVNGRGPHNGDHTHPGPKQPMPVRRRRPPPLLGLPPVLVDELLAVYFTHVHNVWPLIYKPMFNPHTTSPPLLLSMMAMAACMANPGGKDGYDADKLFNMAETALHHCRDESRIDVLQALLVLSLRQTGCGDKRSAFAYAGRASCMALNLGLHAAPTTPTEPDEMELRSRVYWNAYILDKILAEETGRPFLLPYRRSSTPFPSVSEADEFETWPPQIASSAPLPRSVANIIPRRSYVMTFFVWTLRLAMIVENILDIDVTGPPIGSQWDQEFSDHFRSRHHPMQRAEDIAAQLEVWRKNMPPQLEVDTSPNCSPLPHHVIGLAWYHTAKILLYSRFIKRRHRGTMPEFTLRAHQECSESSEAFVDLLAHLDRHKLLGQVSVDLIHMLGLVTLFEAYDASDPDPALAHRAKLNFAQCCIWLRDISSSWPASSAHKVFFEALIQGGLKLSSGDLEPRGEGISPASAVSPAVHSPSMPEGLRQMGRHLSSATPMASAAPYPEVIMSNTPGGSGPNLFQLPQFYWNNLTGLGGGETTAMEPMTDAPVLEWDVTPNASKETPLARAWTPNNDGPNEPHLHTNQTQPDQFSLPPPDWQGGFAPQAPSGGPTDQAAIYAALMSYMVEATKGN